MIEIYQANKLGEGDSFFNFSSEHKTAGVGRLEELSAVALVSKDEKEFQILLEQVLAFFLPGHCVYALMAERFPEYKSRLRSYAGLNYAWRKEQGEEGYFEEEFDLPADQSFFASVLKLDEAKIRPFLEQLMSYELAFCLLSEKKLESIENNPSEFLNDIRRSLASINRLITVNWQMGVLKYADPSTLIFRIHSDGQDRLRLEFYGMHRQIESKIKNHLIPELNEKFYLRHRQPWMDAKS